ncbi:MAG: hypothetical protein ACD_7C00293G0001, partial [uncultured bacterium]
ILHSTVIKIVSLFIALVFPFIGYGMIGASVALIDRVIFLNLNEFSKRCIDNLSWDGLKTLFKGTSETQEPETV